MSLANDERLELFSHVALHKGNPRVQVTGRKWQGYADETDCHGTTFIVQSCEEIHTTKCGMYRQLIILNALRSSQMLVWSRLPMRQLIYWTLALI